MKSLREVLAQCSEAELEQLAQLWATGNAPSKGWAHYRTRLEQGMRDMVSARFVWEHLTEDERLVLYNILGPSARNWTVRDDLPKKVQLPTARYKAALERVKRLSLVLEVLAKVQGNQLVDHRLGFYSYGDYRKLPVQVVDILYVPMEIATYLYTTGRELFAPQSDRSQLTLEKNLRTAPTQPAEPAQLVSPVSSPPAVRPGETIILHDLATIIGAVYQQDIEPTKMGTVPKRIATKIDPLLRGRPRTALGNEGENEYLEMLFDIARELGLLQLSRPAARDIKERYEPGPALEHWSQMGAVEQTRRLLQFWVGSGRWGDVVGANYREWYSGYVDHRAVRGSLVSHVRNCNPGQWYTVASLLQLIRGRDPFVLRPRQRSIASLGYRKASELREHWDTCDREIVIGSLSSSLYELGIAALGYQDSKALEVDEPDNPDFFMLTNLGAMVLLPDAKPAPTKAQDGNRTLVVQPSFELLLLQPDLSTLYSLLPFALVNQVGVVSRLTHTRESILRGVAAGSTAERILQLLEERSQKGVP